jgi:hypothetical protein
MEAQQPVARVYRRNAKIQQFHESCLHLDVYVSDAMSLAKFLLPERKSWMLVRCHESSQWR